MSTCRSSPVGAVGIIAASVVARARTAANADEGSCFFRAEEAPPRHVKRLLEVENGKLCYVVGTVYVDMPLKPNVLERQLPVLLSARLES
jgi:hypothetical protein